MANYCPTCGFPHNHHMTDATPRRVLSNTSGVDVDEHELKCQVCGGAAKRWMWSRDKNDGDFDWVDVETGAYLLN